MRVTIVHANSDFLQNLPIMPTNVLPYLASLDFIALLAVVHRDCLHLDHHYDHYVSSGR